MSIDELRDDTPAPGVLRLTLNRPGARNAISLAVQRALDLSLSAAAEDDGIRVVILAGAGAAFSSGYDLKELAAMTEEDGVAAMLERDELLWRYFTFPKPTVAAVAAVSRGAGTLYAACSDFRVGGPDTDIAVTAATYGGANLTWLLDGLVGAGHARDLLMTSRSVLGVEAYR
ncbi:enoyl-CoA hydratase/isomerase family protein, partial [Nocardia sp.]